MARELAHRCYVALVDDRLRRTHHYNAVGLLLVADNNALVRCSLAGREAPLGVSAARPDARTALQSGQGLD